MIYVEPESGLCNRMRVIDAAIQLAQYRKTKVEVIWKVNHEVGAEFAELFEKFPASTNVVKVINDHDSGYWNIGYKKHFSGIRKYFRPGLIDIADWEASDIWKKYIKIIHALPSGENNYTTEFDEEVKAFWDKKWPGKRYYIRTYSRFFGDVRSEYKMFQPVAEIIKNGEKVVKYFNGPVVGVHIRRTDNVDAIKESPTDKYIMEMERERRVDPSVKFFLATDSQDELDLISEHFKGLVLSLGSTLERDNLQGMKDALTELYCLSKTNKIIGSSSSSFTDTAISYNGMKEYKIIT